MKNIVLLAIAAFSLLLGGSGCATLFAPQSHALAIASEPSGADVYVNGFKMGTTPIELSLSADKSYMIEFRKEGYQTVTRVVNTRVGAGWVILDVIGGLIPIIVDAATGKWNSLDQSAINAALEEKQ